jgi:hypothetical protein
MSEAKSATAEQRKRQMFRRRLAIEQMKDILFRCAAWSALLVVGVCLVMPATAVCHFDCASGRGNIPVDAVDGWGNPMDQAVSLARCARTCDAPVRGGYPVSATLMDLPIDKTDGQNSRGVAHHGYDLGSALEYHVPSGWIRPGEYLHPNDIPLIAHVLPCDVSTHDPFDPERGPIFGSAAVTWTIEDYCIQGAWVEGRRITSASRWS